MDAMRGRSCATLRAQMLRLKAWINARRREGAPFAILGDFNRRRALPGGGGGLGVGVAAAVRACSGAVDSLKAGVHKQMRQYMNQEG